MNCPHAQELLSARMDGEHLTSSQRAALDAHVPGCEACGSFADRAGRVRTAVRIRAAEHVPDLTEPIMARVAREATRPIVPLRVARLRARRRSAPLVAALLAGVIVGSVLVGGPWDRGSTPLTSAAAVALEVRAVAPSIQAFDGTYEIHEWGLAPDVPERQLRMHIEYLAPQRFRLELDDETTYPSAAWTPTDLTYIEDMPATYRSGPTGCPSDLPVGFCPPTRTTITRASSYSAAAPLPADLVAPIATFGSTDGIRVLGEEDLDEHHTVRVELSFARAAPLFPFLRLGGTWRPFFGDDRVVAWFDTSGWYPVRYEVFASTAPARRNWESRFGLPHEAAGVAIADVILTSVASTPPAADAFAIPGLRMWPMLPFDEAAGKLGYDPTVPGSAGHLDLISVVTPPEGSSGTPRSVVLYSAGLEYLRVGEDPTWRGPGPFGPMGADAQQVDLANGGVAFSEPADDGIGRRVAIHTSTTDLYLESNLPLDELLAIASSMPVHGEPLPAGWRAGSI